MKLNPMLVNPEYQDPVMMIQIPQKSEIVLFDLGYCFRLNMRDIRRISRVFISHTHIDHFVGFDHILRLSLDLEHTMEIYGPPGIIKNVSGKLAGYTWNLADSVNLNFRVFEIHQGKVLYKDLKGREGYVNDGVLSEIILEEDAPVCKTPEYSVRAIELEHKMPVMGYRLDAASSFNADIKRMKEMNLTPGKWVGMLKEYASAGEIPEQGKMEIDGNEFDIKELIGKIITKTPGTGICWFVDTIFNKQTAKAMKKLAKDADYLFCEAPYTKENKDLARKYYHMTARQAATIAMEAGVGTMFPIHFSRRYEGDYEKIFEEARETFANVQRARIYKD